jgi:protein-tyrosine phosphatase
MNPVQWSEDLRRHVTAAQAFPDTQAGTFDAFLPFCCIPIDAKRNLFLGNDTLRCALLANSRRSLAECGRQVQRDAAELISGFGVPGAPTAADMEEWTHGSLSRVGLLVSVNDLSRSEMKVTQVQHLYYPISENAPQLYPSVFHDLMHLGKVFTELDDALTQGRDVFVHCNQGEHRSAAVVVLYVMTRSGTSFQAAWKYVQRCRSIIKPINMQGERATLMTEFARLARGAAADQ